MAESLQKRQHSKIIYLLSPRMHRSSQFVSLAAGMQLLLLVSNLLLLENVASKPTTSVSIEDLYHRLVAQSHNTFILAADVYREFVSNALASGFLTKGAFKSLNTNKI